MGTSKKKQLIMTTTILSLFTTTLLLVTQAYAAERIVVLHPAVSPILKQLHLESHVVGITYNDDVFTGKTRIGSHLSPNIELIKALRPSWLIVGSKRAFSDELAGRFSSKLFRYDPRSLEEILSTISRLGEVFERQQEAKRIIAKANQDLKHLKRPGKPVSVVFEISQRPLKMAGRQNIVSSIIEAAGGINLVTTDKKHVLLSPEQLLVLNPRF
jgi:iron complex transport system substrate-binding protein